MTWTHQQFLRSAIKVTRGMITVSYLRSTDVTDQYKTVLATRMTGKYIATMRVREYPNTPGLPRHFMLILQLRGNDGHNVVEGRLRELLKPEDIVDPGES